jgi:hypothetical protein
MDSKSMTIYESDDYGLRLEYNSDIVILHLPYVNKFDKSVLKHLQNKVLECLDFFNGLGYNGLWAIMESSNKQIKRLVYLLGFNYKADENGFSVYILGEN